MRLMAWAIGEVLKVALCDPNSLDSAACSSDDSEGRGEFSDGAFIIGEVDLSDEDEKRALVDVMDMVDFGSFLRSLVDLVVEVFRRPDYCFVS